MEYLTSLLATPLGVDDPLLDMGVLPDNSFRGMASVFGSVVDSYIPTILHRGAFSKTLAERSGTGNRGVKILLHHDMDKPIGLPTRLMEVEEGLALEAKVSLTSDGRNALILLRDGVLDALSIGFDAVKFDFEETAEGTMIRHIREVRLWEISLVTFGADPEARITEVNGMFDSRGEAYKQVMTKHGVITSKLTNDGVNPIRDFDVVDRVSQGDARKRVEAWAGGPDKPRFSQAFVVSDDGGNHYQIADVVNGKLQVTKHQLLNAVTHFHLGNGHKSPSAAQIKAHFKHYLAKFDITPPWDAQGLDATNLEAYPAEFQARMVVERMQQTLASNNDLASIAQDVQVLQGLVGEAHPPQGVVTSQLGDLESQYLDMELATQAMLMEG